MVLQSAGAYLAANWLALLIALAIGFVLGWLAFGRPARRAVSTADAQVAELDSRLRKAESELNAAHRQADGWQASLGSYEASLAEARNQLTNLRSQVQSLEDEKASLNRDLATRSSQLASIEAKMSQVEFELAGAGDAVTNEAALLESQLEIAAQSLQGKDVALREAYGFLGSLQRDLDSREQALTVAERQIVELRREVTELEQHRVDLEGRLQEVRNEVAGELALLTSAMIRMKEEQLSTANARISALNRQLETVAQTPGNG